jgi:hypothetical protein
MSQTGFIHPSSFILSPKPSEAELSKISLATIHWSEAWHTMRQTQALATGFSGDRVGPEEGTR